MIKSRRIATVALALGLITGGTACSMNRAPSNQWKCVFGGGLFESKGLKQTVPPGKSGGMTSMDTNVTIPADDRYYFIDTDPNTADFNAKPIETPVKGTSSEGDAQVGIVTVSTEVQVRFKINEKACQLYINQLKSRVSDQFPLDFTSPQGVWAQMLNASMNQSLINSTRSLIRPYVWLDLYQDAVLPGMSETAYQFLAKELSTALTAELASTLGETYFCGPSYRFDGEADGNVSDCPPLEVTIKTIKPVDSTLIQNLEKIVANEEAQKLIASDQEKAVAQSKADQAKQLAETQRQQAVELAEQARLEEVGKRRAAADLAIAKAEAEVKQQLRDNQIVEAQANAAFCVALEQAGIDCADYWRSINWDPQIITSGDASIVVPAP